MLASANTFSAEADRTREAYRVHLDTPNPTRLAMIFNLLYQ